MVRQNAAFNKQSTTTIYNTRTEQDTLELPQHSPSSFVKTALMKILGLLLWPPKVIP